MMRKSERHSLRAGVGRQEVFDIKNERNLDDWIGQPVEVSLVIRQQDEIGGDGTIRCMNVALSQELPEQGGCRSKQLTQKTEK